MATEFERDFEDGERKFITLTFEDNTEQEFMVEEIYEAANGKQYIAIVPEDQVGEDEVEFFLYRYSEDENGDPILEVIEDEDEIDIALDAYEELKDDEEFNETLAESDEE